MSAHRAIDKSIEEAALQIWELFPGDVPALEKIADVLFAFHRKAP